MDERIGPPRSLRRGPVALGRFFRPARARCREMSRGYARSRRGRMRVDLDLKRLDSFGRKLDSAIDRITIGIMTASLVIGSSIVMTVKAGPTLFGLPLFTVLGLFGYSAGVHQQPLDHRVDLAFGPGRTTLGIFYLRSTYF